MAHPYAELLKDRILRAFWAGITLSAVGSELYRVGAIWLAAELAGPNASLLVTAQSAAILAVSILAGPAIEAVPRRAFLIGTEVVSAVIGGAIVVVAVVAGLKFWMLVAASVLLSAIGVMARPVFLSSLPTLVPGRVRETNGLFDSSVRIAQAVGPFLAAAMLKVMPALVLLAANAVTFLASAAAVAVVGRRLEVVRTTGNRAAPGVLRRLGRGVAAANGCPGIWGVLIATGLRGGGYALGYSVAVPVLFSQQAGAGGLGAVALIYGAGATAEVISTPLLVLTRPQRPLRRLFQGYVLIGASLAAIGAAAALPPGPQLAAMAAAAIVLGVGNSISTLQITTFFATRLPGDDYAAVLRLRMVTIVGSMALTTAAGPWVLKALGTSQTIIACGLVGMAAGVVGALARPARELGPNFETA
jgi:DHA3 family macrolide efflux protein-like MFS transporter